MPDNQNDVTVIDTLTGIVETRAFTPEEKLEYENTIAMSLQNQQDLVAKKAARESALAKLAALGLTEAEIAAL